MKVEEKNEKLKQMKKMQKLDKMKQENKMEIADVHLDKEFVFTNIHVDILRRIKMDCEPMRKEMIQYEKKLKEEKLAREKKVKESDFKNIKHFYEKDHQNEKLKKLISLLESGKPLKVKYHLRKITEFTKETFMDWCKKKYQIISEDKQKKFFNMMLMDHLIAKSEDDKKKQLYKISSAEERKKRRNTNVIQPIKPPKFTLTRY